MRMGCTQWTHVCLPRREGRGAHGSVVSGLLSNYSLPVLAQSPVCLEVEGTENPADAGTPAV